MVWKESVRNKEESMAIIEKDLTRQLKQSMFFSLTLSKDKSKDLTFEEFLLGFGKRILEDTINAMPFGPGNQSDSFEETRGISGLGAAMSITMSGELIGRKPKRSKPYPGVLGKVGDTRPTSRFHEWPDTQDRPMITHPRVRGFAGLYNSAGNCQELAGLAYIIARTKGIKDFPNFLALTQQSTDDNIGIAFCACKSAVDGRADDETGFRGIHYFIAIGKFQQKHIDTCYMPIETQTGNGIIIVDPWIGVAVPIEHYFCKSYHMLISITKYSPFARGYKDDSISDCYNDGILNLQKLMRYLLAKYKIRDYYRSIIQAYKPPIQFEWVKGKPDEFVARLEENKVFLVCDVGSNNSWYVLYKKSAIATQQSQVMQVSAEELEIKERVINFTQYLCGPFDEMLETTKRRLHVHALLTSYLKPALKIEEDVYKDALSKTEAGIMFGAKTKEILRSKCMM